MGGKEKKKRKRNGICGGPFLSTLSCVPKFVGMALSLIGNIWAAVAACVLAEGSEQKGFVQECAGRDSCERRNAAILPEEESLMHIPCSCF